MFDVDALRKDPMTRLLMMADMVPEPVRQKAMSAAKFMHTVDNVENMRFRNTNRNTLLNQLNELERQRALTIRTLQDIAAQIDVESVVPEGSPQATEQWLHVFTRRGGNAEGYTVQDLEVLLRFRRASEQERANFNVEPNSKVAAVITGLKEAGAGDSSRNSNCMLPNHFCVSSGSSHCKSVKSEDGTITQDAEGCACNPFTRHCINLHAHTALGVGSTETLIHNKYARRRKAYERVFMMLKGIEK